MSSQSPGSPDKPRFLLPLYADEVAVIAGVLAEVNNTTTVTKVVGELNLDEKVNFSKLLEKLRVFTKYAKAKEAAAALDLIVEPPRS